MSLALVEFAISLRKSSTKKMRDLGCKLRLKRKSVSGLKRNRKQLLRLRGSDSRLKRPSVTDSKRKRDFVLNMRLSKRE